MRPVATSKKPIRLVVPLRIYSNSSDEFNKKLTEHGDEASRNELIMATLASTYDDAADAFYRNNDALIRSRDAQIKTDESMAKIGDSALRTAPAEAVYPDICAPMLGFPSFHL